MAWNFRSNYVKFLIPFPWVQVTMLTPAVRCSWDKEVLSVSLSLGAGAGMERCWWRLPGHRAPWFPPACFYPWHIGLHPLHGQPPRPPWAMHAMSFQALLGRVAWLGSIFGCHGISFQLASTLPYPQRCLMPWCPSVSLALCRDTLGFFLLLLAYLAAGGMSRLYFS